MKERSKMPRVPQKEGVIIDERCSCGALASNHFPRFQPGQGACPETNCPQFKWVGWVYEKEVQDVQARD